MTGRVAYVQHDSPVWRDRSDFIVNVGIDNDDGVERREQLFVKRVASHRFELCCIPFLYDLALGDVIETKSEAGREYRMTAVVRRSGRCVFRVWFGDSATSKSGVELDLTGLGALFEWHSHNLLAVDASDPDSARRVADYLADGERLGRLLFETGKR